MTDETIKKYTLKIADANKTQIIVIVYEIAEIHLEDAIESYKDSDFDGFSNSIEKAIRCVNDLIDSLDMQYEISHRLMDIYMFINKELSVASVTRNIVTVKKIQEFITRLKKSFEELSKQDTSGPMMGNAQGVYAGFTYGKGSLNESIDIDGNRGFKA